MKGASLARAAGDVFAAVLMFQASHESERPSVGALRSQLLGLLDTFSQSAGAKQAGTADAEEARFALVAWIDEAINVPGWRSATEWEKNPLQLQLFGTRLAGVEFYERLKNLRRENAAAIEVFFLCLALGFQGAYVGREAERRLLLQQNLDKLRSVERALDLAREKRVTPAAYKVAIQLPSRGSRLVRTLFAIALGLLVVYGTLWGVLQLIASGVPLPGNG